MFLRTNCYIIADVEQQIMFDRMMQSNLKFSLLFEPILGIYELCIQFVIVCVILFTHIQVVQRAS
jgi:hypothetical protein